MQKYMHTNVLALNTPELYYIASMITHVKDLIALRSSNSAFAHACQEVFASKLLPGPRLNDLVKHLAKQEDHFLYLELQDDKDLYNRLSLTLEEGEVTIKIAYGFSRSGIIFARVYPANMIAASDFKVVDDFFQKYYGYGTSIATVIKGTERFEVLYEGLASFIHSTSLGL